MQTELEKKKQALADIRSLKTPVRLTHLEDFNKTRMAKLDELKQLRAASA